MKSSTQRVNLNNEVEVPFIGEQLGEQWKLPPLWVAAYILNSQSNEIPPPTTETGSYPTPESWAMWTWWRLAFERVQGSYTFLPPVLLNDESN